MESALYSLYVYSYKIILLYSLKQTFAYFYVNSPILSGNANFFIFFSTLTHTNTTTVHILSHIAFAPLNTELNAAVIETGLTLTKG
jgi:hypothetical protein